MQHFVFTRVRFKFLRRPLVSACVGKRFVCPNDTEPGCVQFSEGSAWVSERAARQAAGSAGLSFAADASAAVDGLAACVGAAAGAGALAAARTRSSAH